MQLEKELLEKSGGGGVGGDVLRAIKPFPLDWAWFLAFLYNKNIFSMNQFWKP